MMEFSRKGYKCEEEKLKPVAPSNKWIYLPYGIDIGTLPFGIGRHISCIEVNKQMFEQSLSSSASFHYDPKRLSIKKMRIRIQVQIKPKKPEVGNEHRQLPNEPIAFRMWTIRATGNEDDSEVAWQSNLSFTVSDSTLYTVLSEDVPFNFPNHILIRQTYPDVWDNKVEFSGTIRVEAIKLN